MALDTDYDCLFKLLVVGDSGVGKSSLVSRFSNGKYSASHIPTIGVDFQIQSVVSKTGKRVKLQIWDTAGQDRFKAITASYYRGGNAIAVCYDTTSRESFEHVRTWLKEITTYARDNVRIVLVGTKADEDKAARRPSSCSALSDVSDAGCGAGAGASSSSRASSVYGASTQDSSAFPTPVTRGTRRYYDDDEVWDTEKEDAAALAKELGVPLVRCSAKTGEGVEAAFMQMAEDLVAERIQVLKRRNDGINVGGGGTTIKLGGSNEGGVVGFFSRLCFS